MRVRLCMLGDGGVGKTALTIQFTQGHFVDTYDPTVEDSFRKTVEFEGQAIQLEILDTAGQDEFGTLKAQWIRDCDVFMLVYSILDPLTLAACRQIFTQQVMKVKDYPEWVPMVLVGNKCDMASKRQVSVDEGQALATELKASYFCEASAKSKTNVDTAYLETVRALKISQEREALIGSAKLSSVETKKLKKSSTCILL